MTDKHLEGAIDRAVREMMDVDADPGFRARVFARLEQPRERRIIWSRVTIAGAAAALVLLVALILRPAPDRDTQVAGAPPSPVTTERAASAPSVPGEAAITTPADQTRASRARRAARPQVASRNVTQQVAAGALVATVAEADPSADTSSARESEEGLTIAPLVSPPITMPPLVIAPLAPIEELRIAPLSPRIERD